MFSRPKKQKQVIIDRQILYMHEVIAQKCLSTPGYFDIAGDNLERLYEQGMIRYGSYLLWQGILEAREQPALFKSLLLAGDSRTAALRRKTIFGGILTEAEREAALTAYAASEMA